MTTMEKLFVQMFERKKWIIDQVKHQSHLFDQHLASTLLIDGIPPPPWLLRQPHSSDPAELKKEELISGLLFPFPQVSAPYSISCNSAYDQPILTADREQIRGFYEEAGRIDGKSETRRGTSVLREVVGTHECALNGPTSLTFSPLAESPHECAMNHVPEQLPTPIAKCPQDQTKAIVPDSYRSLDQSLARIQRSKPRQKDLELRNSIKASNSSPCDQCHSGVNPIGTAGCVNGNRLTNHMDDMDLVRPFGTDWNICSKEEAPLVDCNSTGMGSMLSSHRGMGSVDYVLQPLCIGESVKPRCSLSIAEKYGTHVLESSPNCNNRGLELVESVNIHSNAEDSQGKEKKSSILCGKIIRSRSSTRSHCENESSKLSDSCAIDHEARILSDEAICVDSTEKLKESIGMQAAEIDFCQLKSDGHLKMDRSQDTGGRKFYHCEDRLKQLQQLNAACEQEANPLNLSILVSKVKQPISTASRKITSAKLQTTTNQEDVSRSQMVILSRNGDGVNPKSCSKNAAEMRVVSDKPSGLSDQLRLEMDGDDSKNEPEVPVSGFHADCSVHVEPKQLDFGDVGESKSGLNEIASTVSEERMQDIPALGQNSSLDKENGGIGECNLFSTETHVEETGEGSIIMRQDAAVLARDALEASRSQSSDFLLEKETSKDRFSTLDDKVTLPLDGENVIEHPLKDVELSSLSSLKAVVTIHSSAERSDKKSDTAKPSNLSSRQSKVGYSAHVDHRVSAELEVREPAGSIVSCNVDLILGDHSVIAHGSAFSSADAYSLHDMNIDNSLCQRADPIENCMSGLQGGGCSESDDHHIAGSLSGHKSSPHSGSSWPRSRLIIVGNGEAELPTASSTWKMATSQSSHENYQVRNLSGDECPQEDVPSPEGIITAANHSGVTCCNASCCPVGLDEQNFKDYALEGFRFSPIQQDGEGDPGPSFEKVGLTHNAADPQVSLSEKAETIGSSVNVLDPRTCTTDAVKDQEHGKDDTDLGDAERSASSEGPVEQKLFHLRASSELSSHLVSSPLPSMELAHDNQMIPVPEGFFMQTGDEESTLANGGCSFEKFDIQDTIVERASLIEQLCKSTCMRTPSTLLSTASKLHEGSFSCQSVPNSLLKCVDFKSAQALEDDIVSLFKGGFLKQEFGCDLDRKVDCLPVSGADLGRKPYASPVGKLWEKIHSNSGSSNDKASLNPELPCISEENEIAEEATGISAKEIALAVKSSSAKRKPLADITEDPNCPASTSDFSFCGTNKRPNQKLGTHKMSKKRHTSKTRDNKAISREARVAKIPMEALNRVTQPKTSLQKDGLGILGKEAKRGNIVCNATSFIPLVQQKQSAVPLTGKRDVKVKALEAAEAAKRQEEKREIERKMKKEALKIERARMVQENIRQLELQKKKKEEERKKREAEIATRKRLREDEEKKEKERKRKCVEDSRKRQEEHKEKLCPKEENKEIKIKAMIGDEKKDVNLKTLSENKGAKTQSSETVLEDGSLIPETPHHFSDKSMEQDKSCKGDGIEEQSYEISPYQCSDDEDEDEDGDEYENAPKKFIPSWASKNRIALAISSQHRVDPDLILPPDSFCSIDEVVLPQKLRLK